MTDASRQDSGNRLARDLRRIRETRSLTLQDLNNETKIPVSLLKSFEETALFDHTQFNRVYLRSVVRTYAAAVQISPEGAADALESAFEGQYDGALGREYLGDAADEPPGAPSGRLADERPSVPGRGKREPDAAPREKAPQKPEEKAPPRARDHDADWTSTSPPSGRKSPATPITPTPTKRRRKKSSGGGSGWIFAVVGMIVLGALIWFLVTVLGTNDEAPADLAAADTALVAPEPEPEPIQTRPAVTLGDVMEFHVIAQNDKLDPIRVTVDDDLRRPYWLEQGDSMRFEAQERIVIEELLDRARITVEGYDYPMDRRDDQGRLVITRDDARAFFDGGAGT
jgi:hypothetical protein